jgi:hypothetical protein
VTFTSTTGRVLRITVGAALVLFGLIQLNRIKINLRRFEPALHGVLRTTSPSSFRSDPAQLSAVEETGAVYATYRP